MIVRQLLKRCGTSVSRRWLSEGKRASSGYVQVAQDNLIDNGNIVKCHLPDIHIPNVTIPEVVWQNLDKWPERTAVICSTTGRSYTYAELRRRSNHFARALRSALKLPRGSCIAALLPNVPEYPIVLLGAMEAGIIITTVNPIYTAEEISRQLIDSGARAIVTLVDLFSTASAAAKSSIPIITIKTEQAQGTPSGSINFSELVENKMDAPDIGFGSADDITILPYSSGTTGLPKGVELTHRNIVSNLHQIQAYDTLLASDGEQETISCVLPIFHIYGLSANTLKSLTLGGRLATLTKFTPDGYINMLKQYKPEHLYVVPPIVIFLAAHPDVTPEMLKPIKSMITGAAPVGTSDVERLFQKADREIITLQGYGLTETSPAVCVTYPEMWKECMGSIGMCINNTELKVVSVEDGVTPLGPNEKGELLIKGPQVMNGYHNNPKATDEIFTSDGFLRTGDMVYYDENKIFWISDRLKELIKVKGFQVAPAELEALLRNHPSIADAAVIGVPHPMYGEVPKAFVVAKNGSKINQDEVFDYVASNVASYKKLEGGITVLDSIPKTASGKILRRTLREMHDD